MTPGYHCGEWTDELACPVCGCWIKDPLESLAPTRKPEGPDERPPNGAS